MTRPPLMSGLGVETHGHTLGHPCPPMAGRGPRTRTLDQAMITAHQLEVRAGARLLMADVSFRVGAGDKVGLVGRNGAGKTTLTRILAGEGLPATGRVEMTGAVGYLPQDPRTGDLDMPVRERILSARGLDDVVRRLRSAEHEMASSRPHGPRPGDAALLGRRHRAARRGRVRRRGRGRPDRVVAGHRGAADDAAAAHPLGRPATPGGAGADPVLRRRDAAAGRADQPPRRRLDRVAAGVPARPSAGGWW